MKKIEQTGGTFEYQYDDNGNITSVKQDGVTTSYTYDALGQLTRVDDAQENATWVYTYDQGGNILSKKKYALGVTSGTAAESKVFTYGNANWRDQLTAVDGVVITYDAIGNPLNDGTWQYEWVNGRQLARIYSVDTDACFVYNENGLRVQKMVNGVVTKYTLHGKDIKHMSRGSDELHFFYDAQNKPAVVVYNGTPYSYVKNLQGDIVAILNSAGTAVVNYVYDAWGRPISKTGSMADTLGSVQPFRYRGYVYDEETGLYYLRSRYYTPACGRFVNSDCLIHRSILGHNMYAYCANHPTMAKDPDGLVFTWIKNAWEDTKQAVSDGWNWVSDKASSAWNWTKDTAVAAWDWTTKAAADAWKWTTDKAAEIWDWATRAATDAWNWLEDKALSAWNWIQQAAVTIGEWVAGVAKAIWAGVTAAISGIKNFIVDRFSTAEKASNTLSGIGLLLDGAAAYLACAAGGLSVPTFGLSVPTCGTVALILGVASLPFHGAALVIDIINEE